MDDDCVFKNLVEKWDLYLFSHVEKNAYLIFCKVFGLPSDVIKIIEDNHVNSSVRLGDALHHICHKHPYFTQEDIIMHISWSYSGYKKHLLLESLY